MHISEGVLSAPVLISGAALTVIGTAIGLKKMNYDRIPQVAIMSAAFFVASLVHVPIGPASVHLILNGLLGVLLGWAAFPAILIALALQGVLFQYGGLTSLGVNTFNMAMPAVVFYLVCGPLVRNTSPATAAAGSFLAGFGAVLLAGLFTGLSLFFTGESFLTAAQAIVAAHLPVMVVEGLVTLICVQFLKKVRPEVLYALKAV